MIPISYNLRNLWARRLTTALTAGGMALVVFVFVAILMLAQGLQKTLVETGSPDNMVIIRKGSTTEVQSSIDREQALVLESSPEIMLGNDGNALVAKEILVLISLPKRGTEKLSNIAIRGIGPESMSLRPQVRLVQGRMPRPGSSEIMAGTRITGKFQGAGLGETLRFGMRDWNVVGIFDAGNTGFSSEIWADADQLMQTFRRQAYSSVVLKVREPAKFNSLKEQIESNPRLTVEAMSEVEYYKKQSELMAKFLSIMGISLTIIFSMGAIIGAIITMYSAVANRVREIGTMRALGFQRRSILLAFLMESLLLGLAGGLFGLFFASFLQFITVSTVNFQTFSELAFNFKLSLPIALQALMFSLIMGFVGGILPAFRAARMKIVDALRSG